MTSMPASRSARAITLAPRSWPSRPGLAMTTLSFLIGAGAWGLDDRDFFVLAPDVAQRVAHLAHCRIGADGVEDAWHQVLACSCCGAQGVERARHRVLMPGAAQRLELRQLRVRR